jgi:hypothetical protein
VPGPTGPAGTISVASTTTLAAGSAASVTNTGTSTAATLNFGIPQGTQGIQGIQGPAGETFPTQSGNTGKFLSTNGTSTSWATVSTTAYSNGTNTANSNKIFYNTTGTPPTGTAAGDLYIFY